ncbi:MAG TPA: MGMT family protein, partial [Planctomycetes bacterium]|nr:MGMT family protein [Planctomycetota bacterium]
KWGSGTVVIPAPLEVDKLMRSVPKGKLATINTIREKLARSHGASIACPIATGIFAWIAANAAAEDAAAGRKRVTPWWRTIKSDGTLNEKYPGGANAQKKLLEKEGHKVVRRGKRLVVEDYERKTASK